MTDDRIDRVLVTRLRWLGDVVMSTPMLETLRGALPDARIEYLTYTSFAPALLHHPAVDRVHTVSPKPGPRETLAAIQKLRRARYDWCFDTLGNPRSTILVALSGARNTVAPDRGLRSRLFDHRVRHAPTELSAVRHQLNTLEPLLGRVEERQPSLHLETGEIEAAYRQQDLDPAEPLALVHPGATRPDRAWPVEGWPGVIAGITRRQGAGRVRVVSQPGWETTARKIAAGAGEGVEALPTLDLRTLLALLARADLYVGNDGGILHCAVALRVRTVGIFGPTDAATWFPYARWGPYRSVRAATSGWPSVEDVQRAVGIVNSEFRSRDAD